MLSELLPGNSDLERRQNMFEIHYIAGKIFDSREFRKKGGKTFCNMAVAKFLSRVGYTALNGKLANQCIEWMEKSGDFISVGSNVAGELVNNGGVVVAGARGDVHGHVVICLPGQTKNYPPWGQEVPLCMNIGSDYQFGVPIFSAFKEMPQFFYLLSKNFVTVNQGEPQGEEKK